MLDLRIDFSVKLQNRAGLRSGHIPGSINIPYTDIVHDGYFYPKKTKRILPNQEQPLILVAVQA
jgi:thiosulfate/3-mercaptopyruvate sulfurtransferase